MAEYIERDWLYEQMNATGAEFDLIDALEMIENFPAVDVAPVRHGRWKLVGADKRGRGGNWQCTGLDGCGKSYPYRCDYCPNCGALMKEGDHEAG